MKHESIVMTEKMLFTLNKKCTLKIIFIISLNWVRVNPELFVIYKQKFT